MWRFLRVLVSVTAGLIASAALGLVSLRLDDSTSKVGQAFSRAFMSPGTVFSAPFHYSACPLFKQWFGWSGPGGAFLQMLLVSFVTWAILFATVLYVSPVLRRTQKT
jgi:multisubunit Na+/H+ antiporter MnhB subunit